MITGLIKSNLPARISFQVASRTDSRVVLDEMGADKLLGNGDMLFLWPGTGTLIRGQGTYLSDDEINRVIATVATSEPQFVKELVQLKASQPEGETKKFDRGDDLYESAVDIVIREGRGSVSLLQRALGIGYGRAARLIDYMAEDGIVGPYNGSQARDILVTMSQWESMTGQAPPSLEETQKPKPRRTNKIFIAQPNKSAFDDEDSQEESFQDNAEEDESKNAAEDEDDQYDEELENDEETDEDETDSDESEEDESDEYEDDDEESDEDCDEDEESDYEEADAEAEDESESRDDSAADSKSRRPQQTLEGRKRVIRGLFLSCCKAATSGRAICPPILSANHGIQNGQFYQEIFSTNFDNSAESLATRVMTFRFRAVLSYFTAPCLPTSNSISGQAFGKRSLNASGIESFSSAVNIRIIVLPGLMYLVNCSS